MPTFGRFAGIALVAVLVAAGAPAVASAADSMGESTTQRVARCTAPRVVGMSLQAARARLMAQPTDCLPGLVRDGRHFVTKTRCVADPARFGLIVAQSRIGRLSKKELLVLTVAIRDTGNGLCNQLDPNAGVGTFDGSYSGTFTVTQSTSAAYPLGATVTGVTFDVDDGRLTGDVTGTVDVSGVSVDARYNIGGVICAAPAQGMTFGNGLANATGVVCRDGQDVVVGNYTAWSG